MTFYLLQPRDDLPIVRRDELVEMPLGDHRAVVVRHVLGDRGEGRHADLLDLVQDPQIEVGQILVDPVEQLRLVVEGQADLGEAHQRARKPEVAFQRDPDDRLAPRPGARPRAASTRSPARGRERTAGAAAGSRPCSRRCPRRGAGPPRSCCRSSRTRTAGRDRARSTRRCRRRSRAPRAGPVRFQLAIVWSHHMAHSQRGSRSTGWKSITARNRST